MQNVIENSIYKKRYSVKQAIAYYVEVANYFRLTKKEINIHLVEEKLEKKLYEYENEKDNLILENNSLKYLENCKFYWEMTPRQVVRFGIIIFHKLIDCHMEMTERNIIDEINMAMHFYSTYNAVKRSEEILQYSTKGEY